MQELCNSLNCAALMIWRSSSDGDGNVICAIAMPMNQCAGVENYSVVDAVAFSIQSGMAQKRLRLSLVNFDREMTSSGQLCECPTPRSLYRRTVRTAGRNIEPDEVSGGSNRSPQKPSVRCQVPGVRGIAGLQTGTMLICIFHCPNLRGHFLENTVRSRSMMTCAVCESDFELGSGCGMA